MSANNQTLVKEYKGKWYVFSNVMAESWGDEEHMNELELSTADRVCDTRDEAFSEAWRIEHESEEYSTEYGVQFNRLCKDDGKVNLIP